MCKNWKGGRIRMRKWGPIAALAAMAAGVVIAQAGTDRIVEATKIKVGLTSYVAGTADQVLGTNAAGTAGEHKTISGTANRLGVTHAANSVTLNVNATLLPSPVAGDANKVLSSTGADTGVWNAIVDAYISASAAIARSKIATGPADHVVINSGTGALSSEANLAVTRGGSGAGTFTTNGLLFGNGTSAFGVTAAGTANQVCRVPGAGGSPAFGALDLAQSAAVTGVLDETNGGTGLSAYTLGDVPYASAANTLARLAGNTTTTRNFLRQTGTGAASAAPAWDTLIAGDLPTHVHSAADVTTGTLVVARGGSGAGTFTADGVLLGNGTSAFNVTAAGTANQVLRIPGVGGAPAFGAIDLTQSAAVTGALGIVNGGSGQTTATAAFNALDPLTTKGDIVVHDGTNSIRVAVGTNNQIIIADSAQASGVRWGTNTPSGAAALAVATKTANYTTTASDDLIICDGTITITLLTAVGNTGEVHYIKKTSSASTICTIDADGAQTIDGDLTHDLIDPYACVTIAADGANWQIIGLCP